MTEPSLPRNASEPRVPELHAGFLVTQTIAGRFEHEAHRPGQAG